jgi:2-polyprenyl-3-methyl-5-hydroxy-6-metoxy-1,4-benzoquinol methylase
MATTQHIPVPAGYECHCCGSHATRYLQHYVLRRSLAVAPLHLCASCGSISVDYAVVQKHYPRSKSDDAIAFHKRIRERNEKWSALLLGQVDALAGGPPMPRTLIDIGCGIGTLLSTGANRGWKAIGYEIEPLALAEARSDARLEIRDEFFSRRSAAHKNALVCCIAVLEHLHRPTQLLGEIAAYCHDTSSQAYIFVPTLPENWQPFLDESVLAKGNPFFDNEEHISHFTDRCLAQAWTAAFGRAPRLMTAGGWAGYFFAGK